VPIIEAEKILIRPPNWVGDVVMATPAFRCIRENYPHAKISVLLKPHARKILHGAPWFDESIEYKPTSSWYLKSFWPTFFQKGRFDLGIIFPNSFSSALMMFLSGTRRRVGYKRDARSWLLTDGIGRLRENGKFRPTYMADYYLHLCTHIGCQPQSRELELFVSDNDLRKVDDLFVKHRIGDDKPVFLINPGASYGSSKCWSAEGFATVADLLKEHYDCNVIVVCGPGEVELGSEIRHATKKEVISLTHEEVPLDVLKALVKRCSLLITVDSGPRHYAVAFKKPVVVLMGPTDPRYTETGYEIGRVIRREDVSCSPCHLKTCPTDHRCMKQITPEMVFSTCRGLIEGLRVKN
jgi:heptosyltransferase-2